MKHVCYHILSDLHNEFFNTLEEVENSTKEWIRNGDAHFQIFKLSTEEVEPDEIILDEELVSLDEVSIN